VADLHRQHVIHLDLKPENFLQRKTGEMVMVDFGLSRHDQLPDLLAEEFTIPMGTYPYIAPEQYLRCRDDPRSDLFALGAMLYALATGRNPWGTPETLRGVQEAALARSGAAAGDQAGNAGVAAGDHPAGAVGRSDAALSDGGADGLRPVEPAAGHADGAGAQAEAGRLA
jgi:serine/threonine protein kinase